MLAKKNRLQISVKTRFLGEKTKKTEHFLLKKRKNNLDFCRFGLIISQKNVKKATWRNSVKRAVFEVIKTALPEIRNNEDFLFILLPTLKVSDKKDLEPAILTAKNEIAYLLK